MKQRTMNILIFISLAFNIAFVGSYFYHTIRFGGHRGPMMDHPEPPPRFREKFRSVMENIKPERQEFMEASKDFFIYLTGEEFEEAEAEKQLDKMISKQMEMERKIGQGIISIHSEMSKEELKAAKHFFDNRRDRFKKGRFDRSKDDIKDEKPMRREK